MSVSPTDDALIVALDFEGEMKGSTLSGFTIVSISQTTGIYSLERSAQEDTLLILFNTAISNLVRAVTLSSLPFISNHNLRFYSVTTLLLVATSAASFSLSRPAHLY
jgi:hypothetical protein